MPTRAEINFIEMWTTHARDGVLSRGAACKWSQASPNTPGSVVVGSPSDCSAPFLIESDGGWAGWTLTPRGADLIATAEHCDLATLVADDEPTPESKEPVVTVACHYCEGRGRVEVSKLTGRDRTISELVHGEPAAVVSLPGWDVTCPQCEGRGEQLVEVFDVQLIDQKMAELCCSIDDDEGWVTERTAMYLLLEKCLRDRSPVDVKWQGGELLPSMKDSPMSTVCRVGPRVLAKGCVSLRAENLYEYVFGLPGDFPDPYGPVLTAVRRRPVEKDSWVTESDAMRELLRQCEQTNAPIDARWIGGESLNLNDVDHVLDVETRAACLVGGKNCADFGYPDGRNLATGHWPVLIAVRRRPQQGLTS